jgi:ABC-type phosphate transport system permease subunit
MWERSPRAAAVGRKKSDQHDRGISMITMIMIIVIIIIIIVIIIIIIIITLPTWQLKQSKFLLRPWVMYHSPARASRRREDTSAAGGGTDSGPRSTWRT